MPDAGQLEVERRRCCSRLNVGFAHARRVARPPERDLDRELDRVGLGQVGGGEERRVLPAPRSLGSENVQKSRSFVRVTTYAPATGLPGASVIVPASR